MRPTPPGPYQSHMLRALLSQTRRWLDRGQQAVRTVQVATGWSVQILLYPIYALFQTSRLVGQQIGKAAQPEFPRLQVATSDPPGVTIPPTPSLTPDRPLQQVLQTVQSFAMTPLPVALQPTEVVIRGIASQIEGRSLVLVSQQNQVLNILTPNQQQALEQRIILETATYRRQTRRWRLPGWIGSNLRRLFQGNSPDPLSGSSANSLTRTDSTSLQTDDPIWHSLLIVQQLLLDVDAQTQAAQSAIATTLTPASTMFIRGVACVVGERSLVLVTNQNQVLDVLTCEQQAVIEARIIREVATYYRYWQLRQRAQGMMPLRPPSPSSQAWLPVQVFQGLMAWMQTGPIAIATNLFQEASLPPSSTEPFTLLPDSSSITRPEFLKRLQSGISAALTPPPTSANGATPSSSAIHPPSIQSSPLVSTNGMYTIDREGRSLEAIDIEGTVVGYELSWLERVIRWLDQCFLWVESRAKKVRNFWVRE